MVREREREREREMRDKRDERVWFSSYSRG
jgi:hypothetical protein